MDRRGFLGTILALGAVPAIVRADSLMRVFQRAEVERGFFVPTLASTLDDFETGWIPNSTGFYTRIGNVVSMTMTIPVPQIETIGIAEFNRRFN